MEEKMKNTVRTTVTKLLGTIAIGGTLAAGILASNVAQAASCELANGKSISGTYMQTSFFNGAKSDGGAVAVFEQNGCELRITTSSIHHYFEYDLKSGKMKSKTHKHSGGTWILDLSGEKKAIVPKEYIKANSINPTATAMTKSTEFYSKLQPDGTLELKVLFNLEHDGAVVKVQGTMPVNFYVGDLYYADTKTRFSGQISAYNPIKFRVIPSKELAEKTGARNLVIAHGVNWFLEAFENQLSYLLRSYELSFLRK